MYYMYNEVLTSISRSSDKRYTDTILIKILPSPAIKSLYIIFSNPQVMHHKSHQSMSHVRYIYLAY